MSHAHDLPPTDADLTPRGRNWAERLLIGLYGPAQISDESQPRSTREAPPAATCTGCGKGRDTHPVVHEGNDAYSSCPGR